MMDLMTLSDDDLASLCKEIRAELDRRKQALEAASDMLLEDNDPVQTVPFLFEYTGSPRRKPYIARLVLERDKVERKFYDLGRTYVDGDVLISTVLQLGEGQVYELRKDTSNKELLLVYQGVILGIGDSDVNHMLAIKQYLSGFSAIEALLEFNGVPESGGVPSDLQD